MTELPEVLPATGTAGAGLAAVRAARARRRRAAARRAPRGPVGPLARCRDRRGGVRRRPADLLRHPRARPRAAHAGAVAVPVVRRGQPAGRLRVAARSAVADVRAAHHRRRGADPPLLGGLHGPRSGSAAVLRPAQPVRHGDAAAGARQQLRDALPRLGGRRPRLVPADRLVPGPPVRRHGGEEGVPHEPGRRRRPGDRDLPDLDEPGHAAVHRGLRAGRRAVRRGRPRDHAAAAARRLRQVRPVPAAGLAPGRDGGPHPGLGAHPRRDDGHRRRLPHRPDTPDLRPDRHRPARRRDHRRRSPC